MTEAWPALPYADWRPTKETLHRFAQIVGKVRMALVPSAEPLVARDAVRLGPRADDRADAVRRHLGGDRVRLRRPPVVVRTSDGRGPRGFALRDRVACARFYADLFAALQDVGVDVEILALPYDLGDSPPFADDRLHDSYDADAVERYWRILRRTDEVLAGFASGFSGKTSPTHLFWHGFDLAHARYSGPPRARRSRAPTR